jgi:hypothetical protein
MRSFSEYKNTKHAGQSSVSVVLLFLLVISPAALIVRAGGSTTGNSSSATTCTNAVLDAKVLDTKVPFAETIAVPLTQASTTFLTAIAGYDSSFFGIGNMWKYSTTACTVSWDGFAVNYLLKATNGSQYLLALEANPATSSVSGAVIIPFAQASLPINTWTSYSYSGYALAANSNYNTAVPYTTAIWYVPTISAPTGNCGSNPTQTPLSCAFYVWTGLQNSTYDGYNHVPSHGEVIQTGTTSICSSGCSSSGNPYYGAFSSYVSGNSSGVVQQAEGLCPSGFSVGPGTEINAVVGTGYAINGSSSSTFYTIMSNYTGVMCEYAYNSSTTCYNFVTGTHSACKIAGTEYFADYFAETPQDNSDNGYTFMLPVFTNFDFYDMGMMTPTTGAYPYYNWGYYLYSPMSNGGTPNTSISGVSKNSGTNYASFSETWDSSADTGDSG